MEFREFNRESKRMREGERGPDFAQDQKHNGPDREETVRAQMERQKKKPVDERPSHTLWLSGLEVNGY